MVPPRHNLGFEAEVPIDGFEWVTLTDLGLSDSEWLRQAGDLLVPKNNIQQPRAVHLSPLNGWSLTVFDDLMTVGRHPGDDQALWREFAELEISSPDSLLAFANQHGQLGVGRKVYLDRTGALTTEQQLGTMGVIVEPQREWIRNVALMRTTRAVFDYLRADNAAGLRTLFHWGSNLLLKIAEGVFPGALAGHLASEAWHLDTHPSKPGSLLTYAARNTETPERVVDIVTPEFGRNEAVAVVATAWLTGAINAQLQNTASPMLVHDGKRGVSERLVASTLLATMWGQLYRAFVGGGEYRRCRACTAWFEINGGSGGTIHR